MKIKTLVMTVLSAVAFSLSMPNELALEGMALLSFVGLAPFFWALIHSPHRKWAGFLGTIFGIITTSIQFFWLSFYQDWSLLTLGGAILGFILLYSIFGKVFHWVAHNAGPQRWLWLTITWAVFEFFKSNGFIAFPWGLSPYPLHDWTAFIQIIDIFGMTILSLFVGACNLWVAERLAEKKPSFELSLRQFSALFFTALIFLGYGALQLSQVPEISGKAQILMVQINADPWVRTRQQLIETLEAGIDLSLRPRENPEENPIDLVVWSETSLALTFNRQDFYEAFPEKLPLMKAIRQSSNYWLFGNIFYPRYPDTKVAHNATLLVDSTGKTLDYYGKRKLVPMAEGIPFWHIPEVQAFIRGTLGIGAWTPGDKSTVFKIPLKDGKTFQFGTPICFEDAFPYVVNELVRDGAQALINVSNDSWSQTMSAQNQHHFLARFRAVETKRYLIRSTNSGTSGVFDPWGRQVGPEIPAFQRAGTRFELPIHQEYPLTPYVLWGDWLAYVLIFLLVIKGLGYSWIGEKLRWFWSYAFYR